MVLEADTLEELDELWREVYDMPPKARRLPDEEIIDYDPADLIV